MKPSTIAAIVFVIGSGIAGSYFILKNPLSSASTNTIFSNSGENATAQASGQMPINWISKIGDTIADIASSNLLDAAAPRAEVQTKTARNANTATNLTEAVAQTIFSKMKAADQSGNRPFQSFDPNNPNDQALLSEATQSLDPAAIFLSDTFSSGDIKISSDNSKEAKLKYFERVGTISSGYFSDPKYVRTADQIISDTNMDCFGGGGSLNNDVSNIYKNIVNDYLNLETPSELLNIHKDLITHFKSSFKVYERLANCSRDPVGGYLAAQLLSEIVFRSQNIQNEVSRLYIDLVKK